MQIIGNLTMALLAGSLLLGAKQTDNTQQYPGLTQAEITYMKQLADLRDNFGRGFPEAPISDDESSIGGQIPVWQADSMTYDNDFLFPMGTASERFCLNGAGLDTKNKNFTFSCMEIKEGKQYRVWAMRLYKGTSSNLKKEAEQQGTLYKYLARYGVVPIGSVPKTAEADFNAVRGYADYTSVPTVPYIYIKYFDESGQFATKSPEMNMSIDVSIPEAQAIIKAAKGGPLPELPSTYDKSVPKYSDPSIDPVIQEVPDAPIVPQQMPISKLGTFRSDFQYGASVFDANNIPIWVFGSGSWRAAMLFPAGTANVRIVLNYKRSPVLKDGTIGDLSIATWSESPSLDVLTRVWHGTVVASPVSKESGGQGTLLRWLSAKGMKLKAAPPSKVLRLLESVGPYALYQIMPSETEDFHVLLGYVERNGSQVLHGVITRPGYISGWNALGDPFPISKEEKAYLKALGHR